MDTLILNADATPLSCIPLSVVSWKKAIHLYFLGKINVIKNYDDWVVRSQKLEMKVPSIAMMTEQVKAKRSVKYSRMNIYLRDEFTCQLQVSTSCREVEGKVDFYDLTLDHVFPKSYGGKTNWTNVCTSCKLCNSLKGDALDVYPLRKPYKPSYYEILSRKKNTPIFIKDKDWASYLDWPEHLIKKSKISS